MLPLADEVERRLRARGLALTMGGEPTYVPEDPSGAEWNITAVGPTKLRCAYALARHLISHRLPHAFTLFSPGKLYPGETNPRWVVNLLWRRDGASIAPLFAREKSRAPSAASVRTLAARLSERLGLEPGACLRARDPFDPRRPVAVLPLDHDAEAGHWRTDRWLLHGRSINRLSLTTAEGPAGLRLPLGELQPQALRRALVLEVRGGTLRAFLPPLLVEPFAELARLLSEEALALGLARESRFFLEGYVPIDASSDWERLGLAADPGVLEVNLPPCPTWHDYDRWLQWLEEGAHGSGLRSWKADSARGLPGGTGGGNHLLFGGPSPAENPFFARPAWVASILRLWQAHPCLAYLFTGSYVGPSSQAPRPDESGRDLYDLELAYAHLAGLPAGDHRLRIGETLRHLHTDTSGNTHRSEASFDKFWDASSNVSLGLIEFRAIESLPHASWMSAVALLWRALLLLALEQPSPPALRRHGQALHDAFFLPSVLWHDLEQLLARLDAAGLPTVELRPPLRAIWEWRFPVLLDHAGLTVRRACEGWPLLSEVPAEGGNTSRFVDTSMDRLEFRLAPGTPRSGLSVNGRELAWLPLPDGSFGAGLRYRRTAWYPSLHPGIAPQLPLLVAFVGRLFALTADDPHLQATELRPEPGPPCRRADAGLLTYDLRL
ncbi:MAG: transglutaminase family protein [Verrucomicrobia bacterium]|nr:transglutaminase family protein [Verrucomicrobiota bacterium]